MAIFIRIDMLALHVKMFMIYNSCRMMWNSMRLPLHALPFIDLLVDFGNCIYEELALKIHLSVHTAQLFFRRWCTGRPAAVDLAIVWVNKSRPPQSYRLIAGIAAMASWGVDLELYLRLAIALTIRHTYFANNPQGLLFLIIA